MSGQCCEVKQRRAQLVAGWVTQALEQGRLVVALMLGTISTTKGSIQMCVANSSLGRTKVLYATSLAVVFIALLSLELDLTKAKPQAKSPIVTAYCLFNVMGFRGL